MSVKIHKIKLSLDEYLNVLKDLLNWEELNYIMVEND